MLRLFALPSLFIMSFLCFSCGETQIIEKKQTEETSEVEYDEELEALAATGGGNSQGYGCSACPYGVESRESRSGRSRYVTKACKLNGGQGQRQFSVYYRGRVVSQPYTNPTYNNYENQRHVINTETGYVGNIASGAVCQHLTYVDTYQNGRSPLFSVPNNWKIWGANSHSNNANDENRNNNNGASTPEPKVHAYGPGCNPIECVWVKVTNIESQSYIDLRYKNGSEIVGQIRANQITRAGNNVMTFRIPKNLVGTFQSQGLRFWVVNPKARNWSSGHFVIGK